jgi:putative ABC transport system substrate-binding protein
VAFGEDFDSLFQNLRTAELSVQQPTKFELIVNLRTAKEIALIVPQRVLLKADRVIK